MNYIGTIIEESLVDTAVLNKVKILSQKTESVTDEHQTPWLKKWTLDKVEVSKNFAEELSREISKDLDYSHKTTWYADYKNDEFHYIIFKNRIFKIDLEKYPEEYHEAKEYGISLGIPEYQVDFDKNL